MDVLLVVNNVPLPPLSGGNIHIYNVLRELGTSVGIHLVLLSPVEVSALVLRQKLKDQGIAAASVHVIHSSNQINNWHRLRSMCMLEAPGPAFVERTIGDALRERVSAIVASEDIGLVHVWSPGMAGSLRSFATRPKLLTLGDSFSLLHSTYSDSKPFPRSIYHSRAARGYAVYEALMIKAYDQVVVFNDRDRLQLEKMGGDRLAVIPNGVAPVRICPSSRLPGRAVLAFHGNYSHFPNLQAARFLIGEFRAALTEKLGESGFVLRLAGEDKGGIVKRLTEHTPCTEYVGYIDDLGAFMGEADVYCAPIFSGAGIKNKVLDAFSAGVPIVATPEAVEGVPIRDGEHCVVASRASFADAVARLLSNSTLRAQLASNGRALAGQFSWSSVASKYLELYRGLTGTI